ncbi:PAP2 superfamily protein [Pedobacter steynii]|uniref:PAP2 superfamily protein n=1 Tax=Pedobacter steynii TaxID=430522 RepID=A0A1H0KF45_9SPHI|nr:vanadium-dependent haloperoxidase [Pedobacter steynii]NQX43270.1 phosphatase PAP2 family protein [Pedobacter steynii]SDO54430.1 PAP2 superfamily protein [Pedobacter steynii]
MSEKPLALQWNQLILDAIKFTKTSPPLAARALAMAHTAMYDAWSVFDKCAISTTTAKYIKMADQECVKENTRKAFSYAAYRVLMDLFWLALPSEKKDLFRDLMCTCDYDPDDTTLDISLPQGIGNLVGRLVIERGHGDGANQQGTLHMPHWSDYTGYWPVNTPDQVNDLSFWQPLRKEGGAIQQFLCPHWGLLKSFSLNFNWQFRPAPPFRKEDFDFRPQVKEVLEISAALTEEQKAIASYWADGPGTFSPPGHWCEIAQFIAEREQYRNTDGIKLFFALSNALFDASIACWEAKYYYNSVRPITAIRTIYKGLEVQAWGGPGKGTQTIKGEQWVSYIETPPFPEHVSGHSSFSRAAATVLRQFTGSDHFGGCTTLKTGSSVIEPGKVPCTEVRLDWPTFTSAAEQAGLSRVYGGIHFPRGNEEGQKLGISIGTNAWEKALFYFND